ncbi:MAG: dihydropyrimidinase [Anaerolineaceae bacterium]
MKQLLIKNGKCVCSGLSFVADILADEGKIIALGRNLDASAETIIDAGGRLVFPGGVDMHVHLPWPTGSFISTDTIQTGSRAAAFGGVTSLIDFVIPQDRESLESALKIKLSDARKNAWVDYSFHMTIRSDVTRRVREIPALVEAGFPSFKVFLAYEGFRLEDGELMEVLAAVARANGLVTAHAENGPLADYITARLLAAGKKAPRDYPLARPGLCEEEAVERLIKFQEYTGARLHFHHISTATGVAQIGRARRSGRMVSAETCPHYLVFTEKDYSVSPELAAALICAPSIKSGEDQAALWQGLQSGVLSAVATDHCPYTREQKDTGLNDFSKIPGGMAGLEVRMPVLFSEGVLKNRISLARFCQVWSEGPARLAGLFPRKGNLAVGSDADIVIFNPDEKWTLQAANLHMNTNCLSYEGMEVTGKVETTVLAGKVLVHKGELLAPSPAGQLVPRAFEKGSQFQ